MLTQETQKLISNLLEKVAENERAVEEVRQVLAEQENFDPLALFNKLCNGNNGISREELSYFLEDYSVRHLSREIDQLFFTYNRSRESMGYTSFLKMILPSSSHFLRQLKVELIPHRRKIIEVTSEIEWRLIRILEKELQLYRSVEQQKEQLSKRWDFKVSSAFRCITLRQTNAEIEHGDLLNFIESMNGNTSSDDILNILRRCDHDRDGKIGVLDLEISLTPFKRSKQIYFNQALQQQENKRESSSISQMKSSTKKRSYPMDQQKENAEISFQQEKYAKVRSHSQHVKNHQRREDSNMRQEKIYQDYANSKANKKIENYFSVNVTPTKGDLGQDWETQKPHNKSEVFNVSSSYYNPVAGQYKNQEDSKTVSNMRNSLGKQRTNSFQLEQRNPEEINATKNRESLLKKYYRQEPQQDCFLDYKQELKKQINSEIKEKVQDINNSSYQRSQDFNNILKVKKAEESFYEQEFKEGIRSQIKRELKEKELDKSNQSYKRDLSSELNSALKNQRDEEYLRQLQHKEDIKTPINNVIQERLSETSKQRQRRDLSSELDNTSKVQKAEELINRQKQKEEISNQIQNEIKERALYSLNSSKKNDLSFESINDSKIKRAEELHYGGENKSQIKQQIQRSINEKIQGNINQKQEKVSSSELINPAKAQIAEIPLPQLLDEQKLLNKDKKGSEYISPLKQQSDNFSQYPSKQIAETQQLPNQQENLTQLLSKMISVFREIESLKESLSMRADFNLKDALKAFDLDSQDILIANNFQNFLSKAKIEFSNEQIQCFFSRISPNSVLKTEEIEALFKPLSQEYKNLLENRISFFDAKTFRFDSFSPETKQIVSSLLRESISGEYQLERLKRELSEQKDFSLEKLFAFFEDKRQHGQITHDSLKKAIGSLKLFIVDADIKNIMKRFNSNDNGKVSFENYAHYILPIKIAPY